MERRRVATAGVVGSGSSGKEVVNLAETAERKLVRRTMQSFIDDRWPLSAVRELVDGRGALPDDLTRQAAHLGWFALFVDEERGGGSFTDDRMADAALVAELRGANLQPGAFASVCGATDLIEIGRPALGLELLDKVVEGEGLVVVPCAGDDARGDLLGVSRDEEGLRLSGAVTVDAVDDLAAVLVTARVDGRRVPVVVALDAPGVECSPLAGLDVTTAFQRVTLTDVRCTPEQVVDVSEDQLDVALARVTTLSLVETVATLRALLEMTTDYAKTRVALGRPIGSFQALKHLLADVSVVVEASQAAVDAAVRACSEQSPSAPEVTSIAKVFVGESALDAVQDCLQVHGGIGFAWEHDLHLYMRRVASGLAMFGTPDEHRARIIRTHRDHGELQ